MTWFGQGHSKWVNLSLKHISATVISPRGQSSGGGKEEIEQNTVGGRRREKGQGEEAKGHSIHHAYDSLMFPFITHGSHWEDGGTGQERCEENRRRMQTMI